MKYNQNDILDTLNDKNDAYNDFYASVSVLLRIVSFLFLILFLFFIVYSALGHKADFSYDNFEYIIRNFALTLSEKKSDDVYSIRYNPDSSRTYALIENKFVLCGNSGISIYSPTGRMVGSDTFSFKNPVLLTSDKYALVYDSGKSDLVVYNSFTRVCSQTAAAPIRKAYMADNGYYALITSSQEYNSTVEVYNDNFKLVNRFNKTGYVIDVNIDGDDILLTTVNNSRDLSLYNIEMLMYNFENEEIVVSEELTTSLPLIAQITSKGFYLVCSDELIVYDIATRTFDVISYNGYAVFDYDISNDVISLLLNIPGYNVAYQSIAITDSADILYDYVIDSSVYDIALCGLNTCLLTDGKLWVLDYEGISVIDCEFSTRESKLLPYSSDELYICNATVAPLININK